MYIEGSKRQPRNPLENWQERLDSREREEGCGSRSGGVRRNAIPVSYEKETWTGLLQCNECRIAEPQRRSTSKANKAD
ncbi:hypothetical protein E4U32_007332 [Claviceps aff. humidiphila group G2b]|nr:hypothetical protein E4U32_007332 [Claviceps aff. humidiphila group G2b]